MRQSLLDKIESLETATKLSKQVHINIDHYSYTFTINDKYKTTYKPLETCKQVHSALQQRRLVMGPFGSGKSTGCCAEIIFRASKMPRCVDGVRRSRWGVVRNTYPELKTTTLKTWLDWFGELGQCKVRYDSPIIYHSVFNDGHGPIELELLFLSLESETDIKKLLSLEFTGIYINECRELPELIFDGAFDRTGRYPKKSTCPTQFWRGVICDTNPPDIEHWIYKRFEEQKFPDYGIFKQPPALIKDDNDEWIINPLAENIENIPVGASYYLDMVQGRSNEYIKVYALGEYGTVKAGDLVYSGYNDELHSTNKLEFIPGHPIIVGLDGGLTPAAAICQVIRGQLRVVKEFITARSFLRELMENDVVPWLAINADGYEVVYISDPSTFTAREDSGKSAMQLLADIGIDAQPARTNLIEPRLDAVIQYLTRLVEGGSPALLVSRLGCPALRKGFIREYVFKATKTVAGTKVVDKKSPDKSHPWSDIHDCLQYVALYGICMREVPDEGDCTDYGDFTSGWN